MLPYMKALSEKEMREEREGKRKIGKKRYKDRVEDWKKVRG